MPAHGHLALSLHAGTDRPVWVGHIHARNKDPLLGLHLALRTDDGCVPSENAQRKAFELDGGMLTATEQRGVILGNGNVNRDMRSVNNLGESIAVHEAAAHGVLNLSCGHDPIKRSPYDGAVLSFAGASQFSPGV